MSQLPLPIAWNRRGESGSLLVTRANRQAVSLIRDWARWPSPAALLVGPRRSGRTLLAKMFAVESGGEVIDDADGADEEHLFNRWNLARDSGVPLLLVAREAPPLWAVALPDLRTRLATAAVARIAVLDEETVAALIAHGLEQAGSAFAPGLPDFIARRVTRCYETVDKVVDALNAESLAAGRKLTISTARAALGPGDVLAGASDEEDLDEGADTGG